MTEFKKYHNTVTWSQKKIIVLENYLGIYK